MFDLELLCDRCATVLFSFIMVLNRLSLSTDILEYIIQSNLRVMYSFYTVYTCSLSMYLDIHFYADPL